MTISSSPSLTGEHCCNHPPLRVAEVRPRDATQVPEGFVALGHQALAARLRVHRVTAWRMLERWSAQQARPEVLRVCYLPVAVGNGGRRLALHVLWPVTRDSQAA